MRDKNLNRANASLLSRVFKLQRVDVKCGQVIKMAHNDEELEDLTTCGVCFMDYDDNLNKPKFLQCFHTVCLQCLQVLDFYGLSVTRKRNIPNLRCSLYAKKGTYFVPSAETSLLVQKEWPSCEIIRTPSTW